VIATMARDRYFDLDAVRTPHSEPGATRQHGSRKSPDGGDWNENESSGQNPAGAPPLDWWEIPTAPYKGSHYAAFPPALCERPIKAMCPQRVCTTCGQPSRRITGDASYVETRRQLLTESAGGFETHDSMAKRAKVTGHNNGRMTRVAPTLGWSDCGHGDTWRPGRVLDIFGGSGTTLAVATGHGRDAIGIDLDVRNADLARDRIGMFFEQVTVAELAEVLGPSIEEAA
jgi:site-specific DNA-methyltransferase (adenine-specific)